MRDKILIIKHGALGDVVRTSYMIEPLLNKFNNNVDIYWITQDNAIDLLRFHPFIDNIISVAQLEDFKIKNSLICLEFFWVISLDDEKESCGIVSELKYKKLSGSYVASNGNVDYTADVALWFDMGILSKYGKERADKLKKENRLTHSQIFSKMFEINIDRPSFYNSSFIEHKAAHTYLLNKKKRIGLNLNAGKRWKSKALVLVEAIGLAEKLQDDFDEVLILGGLDDYENNTVIYKSCINRTRLILCEPSTLLEFAAIIKHLDVLVSSDSLALHLAISQNVKTVSFYAPTSAAEIEVFGNGKKVISSASDYCSYKHNTDNSTITAKLILEKLGELV